MRVDLSTFNNDDYNPGSPFRRFLWYFCNVLFLINPWNPSSGIKKAILRLFGAKIGEGVVIKPGVNIKYPWKLDIGKNAWIGERVWIDNLVEVRIEDNVCVSQGALLLCGNHDYKKSTFDLITREITLKEGAWVGAKAIVTGGVVLESHAILTAGSVTSKNLEAFKIYRGNPAEFVRERVIED
ncbi:MAG: WcaF family extracellular polysaccharide biosynthesis acetyltransferase [Crocinitomicaceae bacterium]|nr:WcaF family extracellular polysaccharide biosynthesis acetyltransferase [Crocinitomicaceae bacterium]